MATDHDQENITLLKTALDTLTLYINPQIYKELHKTESDEFHRKNSDFEKHSRYGRQTGKMYVTPQVADALQRGFAHKKKMFEQQTWRAPKTKSGPPVVG